MHIRINNTKTYKVLRVTITPPLQEDSKVLPEEMLSETLYGFYATREQYNNTQAAIEFMTPEHKVLVVVELPEDDTFIGTYSITSCKVLT